MIDNDRNHFGLDIALGDAAKRQIGDYLASDAADVTSLKIGAKIMRDTGRTAPDRISTLPYIKHKHRKISPAVFSRESVGGIQNCNSCHAGAEFGDFDDDRARIPR